MKKEEVILRSFLGRRPAFRVVKYDDDVVAYVPATDRRIHRLPLSPMPFARRHLIAALVLAGAALALYGQTRRFEFVGFDDAEYVVDNPWLNSGFSVAGVRWAIARWHAGNWHPLTWLSHMLDCQLFGLAPGPHHLTSTVLHAINGVLLFGLLAYLTGAFWRPAVAAALFAVHPLRAESVAWVSERKDVLSLLLGLAALWAYAWYAKQPSGRRYALATVLFALGLLAKPMLVTLPCVMLLLDFWPLERMQSPSTGQKPPAARKRHRTSVRATNTSAGGAAPASWPRLFVEKLPLLALAAASSAVTLWVQSRAGAVSGLEVHSLAHRAATAAVAYAGYVKLFFWPAGLAFIYPQPGSGWPIVQVAASAAALVAISVAVAWSARRGRRYLAVGWLWFLGTLAPVIGLVQVGAQAMADRYTYLPGIGLTLMAAWGAADAARACRFPMPAARFAAAAWIAVLCLLSFRQIGTWRNTDALVEHALVVNPQNYIARKIKGSLLAERGDYAAALAEYRQGAWVDGRPVPETLTLMATAQSELGQADEALDSARQAIAAQPSLTEARIVLARLLARGDNRDAAIAELRQALAVDPPAAKAHANLAVLLAESGDRAAALQHARTAVELMPRSATFLVNLGVLLLRSGDAAGALERFEFAAAVDRRSVEAQYHVGLAQATLGNNAAAVAAFEAALAIDSTHAPSHFDLGRLHEARGQWRLARIHYEAALAARPIWLEAINNLAWLLATCPDDASRDGPRAVQLAQTGRELTKTPQAGLMDTLAAVYAEAQRWPDAVQTAAAARALAEAEGQPELAAEIGRRLALYQAQRPYRQAPPPAAAVNPTK